MTCCRCKKCIPLVSKTLKDCYKKIDLYHKADQEYKGGIEANILLNNIREVLRIIQKL